MTAKKRLEQLRTELEEERISYGELSELASLADQAIIDPDDMQLLEAAGVPEDSLEDYRIKYERLRAKRITRDAMIAGGVLLLFYGVMVYQAVTGFLG